MDIQPITQPNAIEAAAYLLSLRSDTGRRGMISALNGIAEIATGQRDWRAMDWRTLNPSNAAAIRGKLKGAPATINKSLAALRGVAKQLFAAGHINGDEYQRIKLNTESVNGSRLPEGRNIEDWEVAQLMRMCAKDPTPHGARDAAIIAVAHKTGARREELTNIQLVDIALSEAEAEIKVIGKGNKERMLYLDNGAYHALRDWLEVRGQQLGPLFVRIRKGGKLSDQAMTTTAMHKMLEKRVKQCGLTSLSWHDFRRTVAGELLDAGADIAIVQQLLGHSDPRTTARYDRRPAEARKKAARRIKTPYYSRAA